MRPDIALSPDLALAKPSVDHIPLGGFVLAKEGPMSSKPDPALMPHCDPSERRTKRRTTINHGAVAFFKGRPAFTLAVYATSRTTVRAFG